MATRYPKMLRINKFRSIALSEPNCQQSFWIGQMMLAMLLLVTAIPAACQPADKPLKLMAMLRKQHVQPRVLDSSTSQWVLQEWLAAADPYCLYLDASASRRLMLQAQGFPQFSPARMGSLLDTATRYIYAGRKRFYRLADSLLTQPLIFERKDSIDLSPKPQRPVDAAALFRRQQQFVAWSLLDAIADKWEARQEDKTAKPATAPPEASDAWIQQQEQSLRKAQAERYATLAKRLHTDSGTLRTTMEYLLLNAIAAVFDPHSNYFDAADEDAFEGSLSSVQPLFGFRLQENSKGELSVAELLPGSPAWNCGQVFEGDQLVAVTLPNGTTSTTAYEGAEAVMKVIDAADEVALVFTLRSADGKEKNVSLTKAPVVNTDNLVRGYILKGSKSIGYVSLPSFYTAHDGEGTGVAHDLSKEIIKLKREKIEGLILDLRYNGGGSMAEAAAMAGIFIDLGPVSLSKQADGTVDILKDPSRGLIYDGPLTVLINGQSASASELVAGVLQDYKRATIIGSPSFGKATMQLVLPLDSSLPANREKLRASLPYLMNEAKDFVKITTGRFYRITGQSHQQRGIIPDVMLPDVFEVTDYSERSNPFALQPDIVDHLPGFTPWAGAYSQASNPEVIAADAYFKDLDDWIQREKKQRLLRIPLQWKAFMTVRQRSTPPDPRSPSYGALAMAFQAANTSYTEKLLSMEDASFRVLNQKNIETLNADRYVNVAYKLMTIQ